MTGQKEIRAIILSHLQICANKPKIYTPEMCLEDIVDGLTRVGVVIKADTAKPPIVFSERFEIDCKLLALIVERVRDAYAGYVAVESLVEE